MYGIGGETDLTEHTLDHLSGYLDSRPVRIGNGAFDQHQHDVWGMLLDAVATHIRRGGQIAPEAWRGVVSLVDQAIERYTEPDQGIWEMRGDPQHFVASKVMCWVASQTVVCNWPVSREDDERVERWRSRRRNDARLRSCEKGVDERGVFVQHYEHHRSRRVEPAHPDHGVPAADDERVRATVLAIADELTQDGLVLRYRVDKADDGLSGEEGRSPSARSGWCPRWR